MLGVNLSNVDAANNYPKPGPGGYVIQITSAKNNAEKERIEMEFDIVEGSFSGYYRDMKERLGWHTAKFNKSYKQKALSFFKGFIEAILNSNGDCSGLVVGDFEDIDETKLVGKRLGMVVGEAEYIGNDGLQKVKLDFYNATFVTIDTIHKKDFTIPEYKALTSVPNSADVVDTTVNFGPISDDDMPF